MKGKNQKGQLRALKAKETIMIKGKKVQVEPVRNGQIIFCSRKLWNGKEFNDLVRDTAQSQSPKGYTVTVENDASNRKIIVRK